MLPNLWINGETPWIRLPHPEAVTFMALVRPQRWLALLPLATLSALTARSQGVHIPGIVCPFQSITGIPCPTCHLTRSAMASLRGELGLALHHHIFGPPLVGWLGWVAWRSLFQGRLVLPLPSDRAFAMVLMLLMGYWLLRVAGWTILGWSTFPP